MTVKAGSRPIVLVFASQGIEDSPYHQWCESNDFDLQIICDKKHAAGYALFAPTRAFENYRNDEPQKWAEDYLANNKVVAILSRAEIDVIRCAKLREKFNIKGHLPEQTLAYRDKYLMKNQVVKAGIRCPYFHQVESLSGLHTFCRDVGFPVVVKPVDASGGVGIVVLHSEQELQQAWQVSIVEGMLAESFVNGPMYHIDGLAINGKLVFSHVSQYFNSCLSWQDNDCVGSIGVNKDTPVAQELIEATQNVLTALPKLDKIVFHCEFFINEQNQPVFCEIACRTGGARIVSQVAAQTGINLDEVWAKWQCGLEHELTSVQTERVYGHLLIPPEKGKLLTPPTLRAAPWVEEAVDLSVSKQTYTGASKSGEYLQSYVAWGNNEDELQNRFRELIAHSKASAQWEANTEKSGKKEAVKPSKASA